MIYNGIRVVMFALALVYVADCAAILQEPEPLLSAEFIPVYNLISMDLEDESKIESFRSYSDVLFNLSTISKQNEEKTYRTRLNFDSGSEMWFHQKKLDIDLPEGYYAASSHEKTDFKLNNFIIQSFVKPNFYYKYNASVGIEFLNHLVVNQSKVWSLVLKDRDHRNSDTKSDHESMLALNSLNLNVCKCTYIWEKSPDMSQLSVSVNNAYATTSENKNDMQKISMENNPITLFINSERQLCASKDFINVIIKNLPDGDFNYKTKEFTPSKKTNHLNMENQEIHLTAGQVLSYNITFNIKEIMEMKFKTNDIYAHYFINLKECPTNYWKVGNFILKNYCVAMDGNNQQIGFSKTNCEESSTTNNFSSENAPLIEDNPNENLSEITTSTKSIKNTPTIITIPPVEFSTTYTPRPIVKLAAEDDNSLSNKKDFNFNFKMSLSMN